MSGPRRVPGYRGAIQSQPGSPLPQEEAGGAPAPVRVADAFYQFLPQRSTQFFQRVYFAAYPRPVQQGGLPGFPRNVPIARIQVPAHQAIIIQSVTFAAYEHTGIGADDIIEVPPSRTVGVFGYQFQVGSRGMTDFNTNITTGGNLLALGPNANPSFPPSPGQGSFFPLGGSSVDALQNFANYAMPQQGIEATAIILRAPPFDTRLFSVAFTGVILPEVILFKILSHLGSP